MTDKAAGAVLSPPEAEPAPEPGDTGAGAQDGAHVASEAVARVEHYLASAKVRATEDFKPDLHRAAVDIVRLVAPQPTFPAVSLREALPHLRRPFAPNAIRWKVQVQFGGNDPHSAQIAPYINAATVVDLLNLVCAELWHDEYDQVTNTVLRCRLTIDGVTRTDVGEGSGKTGYSDALKRAAMRFGVGVFLRATPRIVLRAGGQQPKANQLRVRQGKSGPALALTDPNLDKLRKGYADWLKRDGVKHFGDAFDFGDVADATGDVDDLGDAEHAPEDMDPETGEVEDPGPKIRKPRLEALTKLIDTAPPWWTPDDAHQWLDDCRVALGETDLLTRLKQLGTNQAGAFEAWLRGLPVEQPEAPEIQ